jgi:L-ascorbate metabolism protein UlaG (beta-lactamase superfamily)
MKIGDVELKWLGNSGFLILNSASKGESSVKRKVIYIDPYKIKEGLPKADIILLTHDHYDHCSVADLEKIIDSGTTILMTSGCQSKVARFDIPLRMELVSPGQDYEVGQIKISTFPAYNVNKHFHKKDESLVGFIIKMKDVIIYHAGDTDLIPEMSKLTGYNKHDKTFIALLPVGGRFTMSAEEAAEAAKTIRPSVAIPMHWGSVMGTEEDAEEFKELAEKEGVKVKILRKE